MNAKKILIWLVCLCIISMGSLGTYRYYNTQPTITTREQCFSGSIDACVTLDKQNKQLYKQLEDTQQQLAENNKAIKQQASKLLSWSSFH